MMIIHVEFEKHVVEWLLTDDDSKYGNLRSILLSDCFNSDGGCTVEVWELISNFTTKFYGCNHLSIPGLKLNRVS